MSFLTPHFLMGFPHTNSGQGINHQFPPYAPLAAKPPLPSLRNSVISCQVDRQLVSTLDSPPERRHSSYSILPHAGYMSPVTSTSSREHRTPNVSQLRFPE